MASYGALGRGINAGPATDFFPLSGTTASSPSIAITATAAAGTTLHTADLNAQDVVFLRVSNVSTAALVCYTNTGSTATTGNLQTTISPGSVATIYSGDISISKSGVLSAWTTASTGLFGWGYVARTYTATG